MVRSTKIEWKRGAEEIQEGCIGRALRGNYFGARRTIHPLLIEVEKFQFRGALLYAYMFMNVGYSEMRIWKGLVTNFCAIHVLNWGLECIERVWLNGLIMCMNLIGLLRFMGCYGLNSIKLELCWYVMILKVSCWFSNCKYGFWDVNLAWDVCLCARNSGPIW